MDSRVLTLVEPEEVEMLVSPSNLALGNKKQGSASFRILEKRVLMTQLWEKQALFQHLVTAGNLYQIRPDGEDDGLGDITLFCREYAISRVYPKNQSTSSCPRRNDRRTDYWSWLGRPRRESISANIVWSSELTFREINQEFESQRFRLNQARRWADQAQRGKIS